LVGRLLERVRDGRIFGRRQLCFGEALILDEFVGGALDRLARVPADSLARRLVGAVVMQNSARVEGGGVVMHVASDPRIVLARDLDQLVGSVLEGVDAVVGLKFGETEIHRLEGEPPVFGLSLDPALEKARQLRDERLKKAA
jgi:hypothetical protein